MARTVASGAANTEAKPLVPHAQGMRLGAARLSRPSPIGIGKPITYPSGAIMIRPTAHRPSTGNDPAAGANCRSANTSPIPRATRTMMMRRRALARSCRIRCVVMLPRPENNRKPQIVTAAARTGSPIRYVRRERQMISSIRYPSPRQLK